MMTHSFALLQTSAALRHVNEAPNDVTLQTQSESSKGCQQRNASRMDCSGLRHCCSVHPEGTHVRKLADLSVGCTILFPQPLVHFGPFKISVPKAEVIIANRRLHDV